MSYSGSVAAYYNGEQSTQIPALFSEWVKTLPVTVTSHHANYYFNEDQKTKEPIRKEDTKPAKAG